MASGDGKRFGKYKLLDRLATGGMAEIYRARYTAAAGVTKEMVIKKILPAFADNRRFVQMFIDEAKISVGLSHGNIAQVFDFGEIDGEYFLAMEFVDGQPLSRVLKALRARSIPFVPSTFAAYIALQVCRGLHYAHTRLDADGKPLNIIHRDVSAQNVLLAYEGQIKLVDFGIAKARMAGRDETQTGAVKGKYLYFAPEQARGKELDARTDVYAVGVLLYEMACGRLPFEGKMIEVLGKIVKGDFKRPRELNPDLTPAFERIILAALATDRGDRYPSAQALAEALSGYLYANAPTFGPEQVVRLLSWLNPEAAPQKLPREFLEQVEGWKRGEGEARPAAPAGETRAAISAEHSEPTTDGRASGHAGDRLPPPVTDSDTTAEELQTEGEPAAAPIRPAAPRPTRLVPRAPARLSTAWLALPVGAALLAAAVVLWFGRAPSSTPRAQGPAPDEPLPRPAQPRAAAMAPPAAEEHAWSAAPVRLLTARHAFPIVPTRAARIRLDPRRTYRVWLDPLEGGSPIFAQPEGAPAREVPNAGGEEFRVSGASALYAWVTLDDASARSSPSRLVRLEPQDGAPPALLHVDPRQNAVGPAALPGVLIVGLDPAAHYAVTSAGRASPSSLLAVGEGPGGAVAQLLAPGASAEFTGARTLRFALPDDRLDDNSGELSVSISPKN